MENIKREEVVIQTMREAMREKTCKKQIEPLKKTRDIENLNRK